MRYDREKKKKLWGGGTEKYVSVREEGIKKVRDGKSIIVLCSLYTGGGSVCGMGSVQVDEYIFKAKRYDSFC